MCFVYKSRDALLCREKDSSNLLLLLVLFLLVWFYFYRRVLLLLLVWLWVWAWFLLWLFCGCCCSCGCGAHFDWVFLLCFAFRVPHRVHHKFVSAFPPQKNTTNLCYSSPSFERGCELAPWRRTTRSFALNLFFRVARFVVIFFFLLRGNRHPDAQR